MMKNKLKESISDSERERAKERGRKREGEKERAKKRGRKREGEKKTWMIKGKRERAITQRGKT